MPKDRSRLWPCSRGARGSGHELAPLGEAHARHTDPALLEALPAASSVEDEFARREAASSVQAAVSALAPKIRIAVLLRYFDELSYAEMAAVLNCSMGTVASRLSRGHEILARQLAQFSPQKRER